MVSHHASGARSILLLAHCRLTDESMLIHTYPDSGHSPPKSHPVVPTMVNASTGNTREPRMSEASRPREVARILAEIPYHRECSHYPYW